MCMFECMGDSVDGQLCLSVMNLCMVNLFVHFRGSEGCQFLCMFESVDGQN